MAKRSAVPSELPSQSDIFAAPLYFVDANLGIATGRGVARVTFGTFKLNVTPGATLPSLHPTVTIAVSEEALLEFAREVIDRAGKPDSLSDGATS